MLFNLLAAAAETPAPEPAPQPPVTFGSVMSSLADWALHSGVRIIISILILLIGFRIINVVARKIEKKSNSKKFDKTLTRTLIYLFKIGLKILICICLIGYLGIDTSGLTALVASLGVCVGLAVNGALSNFAGGVLLIITRPFKIDDFIEAQGVSGTVEDIRITTTRILTPDGKVIYLPNGALSTGNIINYSEKGSRRMDFTFSIGYSDDYEKAKQIILDICNNEELALKNPAPFVQMIEHAASSINIVTRVWATNENYWTVYFSIMEKVKKAFDENGIEIPFNQLDVHVKND